MTITGKPDIKKKRRIEAQQVRWAEDGVVM
jgi:hypothetical protein